MAIWRRKKNKKDSKDTLQKNERTIAFEESAASAKVIEESVTKEQPNQEESISQKAPEFKSVEVVQEDMSSGVILRGKKISGLFGKGFWGILSILVLPPVFVFAFGILTIIFMLIFPLLAVVLIGLIPVVFVTISIFLIVLPVVFPMLVLFLLITGKGRLLIASEGKWFSLKMLGKSYSLN